MTSSRFFPPALTNPPAIRLLVRSLLALTPVSAWAELPVPADVMVAVGAGRVAVPVLAGNTLILRQASDKATLDWKSFNIGADNTVRFEQPHSDSVALNRIHQADPSQILGTLTANGQIYMALSLAKKPGSRPMPWWRAVWPSARTP